MPRARFEKLPAAQRSKILDAAFEEFAAHGYGDASLNRIIAAAGISKGSLYYYFDDKADLYVRVIHTQMLQLVGDPSQIMVPEVADVGAFWVAIDEGSFRMIAALSSNPAELALMRDALSGSGAPVMRRAQQGLDAAMAPWVESILEVGQRIGAVRRDLPTGLLVAVVGAMGQAMDSWLVTQELEPEEYRRWASALVGMLRRALEPGVD